MNLTNGRDIKMGTTLNNLLQSRQYLEAEHWGILKNLASCKNWELKLIMGSLARNQLLLAEVNDQIKEHD